MVALEQHKLSLIPTLYMAAVAFTLVNIMSWRVKFTESLGARGIYLFVNWSKKEKTVCLLIVGKTNAELIND